MARYGVIDFDEEEIDAAGHWYGGQGSMLYAILSTGALSRGTIRPRNDDGTSMTDDEWMIDLAERLEREAEDAARDAAKQAKKAKGDEKKELKKDVEGLNSIAFKAAQYVRDAQRGQKSSHATKKETPGAARRDYQYRAVVVGKGPLIGGTKRHESSWFSTKKKAEDWAWAIRKGNEAAGRAIAFDTIERRHGKIIELVAHSNS